MLISYLAFNLSTPIHSIYSQKICFHLLLIFLVSALDMRFIAHLQEYAQPILNGQTGNLKFEKNCHILEPGEPSFSTTRQRLFHQYLCHNIKYCNVCSKLRTSPVYAVKYVAHKVIHTPWLYGPASLRNKTLIYPCEKFQCQIGCPCKRIQRTM